MSLKGFALIVNPVSDVVSAYAAASVTLRAIDEYTPSWIVYGAFRVPESVRARLEVTGFSVPGVSCSVALYAPGRIPTSLVAVTSVQESSVRSAVVQFEPNVLYQIAAKVTTATPGDDQFALLRTTSLVGI